MAGVAQASYAYWVEHGGEWADFSSTYYTQEPWYYLGLDATQRDQIAELAVADLTGYAVGLWLGSAALSALEAWSWE